MIKPGQHVKLILRNGLVEEGLVLTWSEKQSTIRSLQSANILVILKTLEDVIAVKVFLDKPEESIKHHDLVTPPPPQPSPDVKTPSVTKIYTEVEQPDPSAREFDSELYMLNLVELHKKRKKIEEENARKALKTFTPSMQPVEYGLPRRLAKPPHFNPKEKIKPYNTKNNK